MNLEAMKLINELENEFGSLSNVPKNSQKMARVEFLLNGGASVPDHKEKPSELKKETETIELIHKGISRTTIMSKTKTTAANLDAILEKHNLSIIPPFRYKIKSERKADVYVPNVGAAGGYLFGEPSASTARLAPKLGAHGYYLEPCKINWYAIKDGSLYIADGVLYKKDGLDSYKKNRQNKILIKTRQIPIDNTLYKKLAVIARSSKKPVGSLVSEIVRQSLHLDSV